MRYFLIFLVIMLLVTVGYGYQHNPAGCQKVLNDVVAVFTSTGAPQPETTAPPTVQAAPAPAMPPPAAVTTSKPVPVAPTPPSNPLKAWAPPEVIPAQPNWTWNTSDGKTYQNVVVTKIEPDTVSITHAMGVAHIPMDLLPPDIQKQLNYDPKVAAAARAELQRESEHPYYPFATAAAEAERVAHELGWPVAWIESEPDYLSVANPAPDSEADLTQTAVNHLKSQTVIIFCNGNDDLFSLPSLIRDQLFILDDGPIPGGHHFYGPKIIFSDPEVTKTFGRVSYTQMKASGPAAIDAALASIPNDSSAQPATHAQPAAPAAPAPASPPPPAVPAPTTSFAPAPSPSPDAAKPWAPPDVMPAQPNWTWTTSDGTTYQNVVVTKIEPDTVSITHSTGVAHIAINLLPPDIQKQLNYDPGAASQIATLIYGKLTSSDGTAANPPDSSVQYFAIYYSAQWCPPCHAFTPRLVKWYNAFKPSHPNFELIFVSEDHNETSMFDYMKEMSMPWPAVRFGELKHDGSGTFKCSGIEKFAGTGIPDLVLVDASGKVLSDSFQNGTYYGPETVVDDINKLIGGSSPVPLARENPSAPSGGAALISTR